jgi:hypothetical protein
MWWPRYGESEKVGVDGALSARAPHVEPLSGKARCGGSPVAAC